MLPDVMYENEYHVGEALTLLGLAQRIRRLPGPAATSAAPFLLHAQDLPPQGTRLWRAESGVRWFYCPDREAEPFSQYLPDLTDAATRGVLLQMVRHLRRDAGLHTRCTMGYSGLICGWKVYTSGAGALDHAQVLDFSERALPYDIHNHMAEAPALIMTLGQTMESLRHYVLYATSAGGEA